MKIAQGKRGTSAALGEWQKEKSLPLCLFVAPSGAEDPTMKQPVLTRERSFA
jgi:hypothetical protein